MLLLSFLFFLHLPCAGQTYSYVHYDTKDGLAGSVVYDMVQDHDGYIWFATETGLSRFDGSRFDNFTVKDGLPDNEIVQLYIDSKQRLWLLPFSRAICYYRNGTIYNKDNDSLIRRLTMTGFARSIVENERGDVMIVQEASISIIKADGTIKGIDRFMNIPFDIVTPAGLRNKNDFVFSVSQGGRQNIFEYRNDSLCLVSSWKLKTIDKFPFYFSGDLEVFTDEINDEIRVISDSGSFQLPKKGFLKLERLNDSLLVVCSDSRVDIYNIYRRKLERTIYEGRNVNNFLEDSEGNWWFSSIGSGVYRLPSTEIKNYVLKIRNDVFPVSALEKYKDTLYAGTDHFRLWTIDLKTHDIQHKIVGEGQTAGRIITLNRMPNGSLFAGTEYDLFRLMPHKIVLTVNFGSVKSSYAFGDSLLLGTSWSAYCMDTRTMHTTDTLLNARSTAVFKKDNIFYLGTLNGLYKQEQHKDKRYLGSLHPSLAGKISSIRGTDNGIIWVGTYGFGIIGLKNEQVVATINADSGLTSNICRTLYAKGNILWVGTDKGLNKVQFDGKKCTINKYTEADGLASDMINAILQDGHTIYVGTPAGVSFFNEERVFTQSMCRLKIRAIQTSVRRWQRDTSGLQFGHYENDIRIEFAGISFKSGGEILYRYKLHGLDESWRETRDNFLNFLSLPSGDYDLELSAVNKFGVQSSSVHLRFSVAKLVWEETWFRVLAILMAALLVWLSVRYRIRTIRREAAGKMEISRKITELEQMALKAQMNPHFIFNSLHSIQQYVIDKDVAGANKYISDFARIIRLTLDISSQPKISLFDEINYISTYLELEKARYEGKFDYEINTDGDIDEHSFYIPAMLLQPYVENSIRHGIYHRTDKKGMIRIDFRTGKEYLVCTIEDNGVGRKASEQLKSHQPVAHQSKGMAITAKRIDMLNQQYIMPIFAEIEDVYDETGSNKISGTRVILRFPLKEVKKQA